ncbi:hypothetical protein PRUB_a1450 [Pseudoalteromonas rubra]|uniref:Uncharacterized protein n=1 Tax=Pseudoalteromonas rubra TaxID=43658 RepID=A0A8T0C7Q4_9GAMM|nr:hypothetical protein [Pseudoalteromonas rubra]KAF7786787.1 hypothetical protein PRUB_a1450 [Pseudoalteromonas rubra]
MLVLYVVLMCLGGLLMLNELRCTGVTRRSWVLLAAFAGPVVWILFRAHYRLAWLKQVGQQYCILRA